MRCAIHPERNAAQDALHSLGLHATEPDNTDPGARAMSAEHLPNIETKWLHDFLVLAEKRNFS
ncbi:MAG: hypothetical protein ACRDA1_00485, partial [Plesiomonas shigelloides]